MAVPAGSIIYCSDGSNNNAGYFKAAGAGTDYPRAQAAPVLSLTDLACTAGSTTVTSATGGFTAAMQDNGLYIASGTNFKAGLYQIATVVDANTITVDRSPAPSSNGSSGVGKVGGRRAVLTDAFVDASTAYAVGMVHEVWGDMTLTESVALGATSVGNSTVRNVIEGRSSAGVAEPTGDDRPLITCGAYSLDFGSANYWEFRDLDITGTGSLVLRMGSYSVALRCSMANTSTTSERAAAILSNGLCTFDGCEFTSPYGTGLDVGYDACRIVRCYMHDCGTSGASGARAGLDATGMDSSTVEFCIIDTCRDGIYGTVNSGNAIEHNTIYNCSVDGWYATAPVATRLVNNIFMSCGIAARHLSYEYAGANHWDYNLYYDNDTDHSKTTAGVHDITGVDPQFDDASNGDFRRTAVTTADGLGPTLGVG